MTSELSWQLLRHFRKVWVRVVSFALLGVGTAIFARIVAPLIPSAWTAKIGADSVEVLNILVSAINDKRVR